MRARVAIANELLGPCVQILLGVPDAFPERGRYWGVQYLDATSLADGDFEAHLIALSCSKPPKGQSQWSLRLLAERVVELDYIDSVSYETVRRVLKKTKSNRGDKSVG